MRNTHPIIPSHVAGFENYENAFSIIMPEETTNLFTNPSVETNLTGYTVAGAGAAMARTSTYQRRGTYSIQITPGAGVNSGCYRAYTVAAATNYTFSLDVYMRAGKSYILQIYDTVSATNVARKDFIGRGFWQRISLTYKSTGANLLRFQLWQRVSATLEPFYTDGWQLEQKAYPTTYCDGDQVGFVIGEYPYYWHGTPHASTSTRKASTRSGGKEVKLSDIGLVISSVVGLGMAPVINAATPMSTGGEFYQNSIYGAREFVLSGSMQRTMRDIGEIRNELWGSLHPYLTEFRQPLVLRYTPMDMECNQSGETRDIVCVYQSGLEGVFDSPYSEDVNIMFRQHMPLIAADGYTGRGVSYLEGDESVDYFMYRDTSGVWRGFASGVLNGPVYAVVKGFDNVIYVGGNYTNASGVAAADYLSAFDPVTGAFTAVTATPLTGTVRVILPRPDGRLYVGGSFLNAGGLANADCWVLFDPATDTWTAVNATPLAGGAPTQVNAACFDRTYTYVYIGGDFLNAGGAALADYLCRMDVATGAYSAEPALAFALNGVVRATVYESNSLYFAGDFTVPANYIIEVRGGVAYATTAFNSNIYALAKTSDGRIIIGGTFTSVFGDTTWNYLAYTGDSYSDAQKLVPIDAAAGTGVYGLYVDSNNIIYVCSDFGAPFTSITLASTGFFRIINNTIVGFDYSPNPITVPSAQAQCAYYDEQSGRLYAGVFYRASPYIYQSTNTLVNAGDNNVYPTVRVRGPGTLYSISNYTTSKAVFFNGLTLFSGELLTIDFNPAGVSMTSNVRGNMMGFVQEGSQLDIYLMPGTNNFSVFMYGGTWIEYNDNNNQLSNYDAISGITGDNTNNGTIYVSIANVGPGAYQVTGYSNAARTYAVFQSAVYLAIGRVQVTAMNNSGISGYIRVDAIVGVDVDIYVEFGLVDISWKQTYLGLDNGY